METDTDATTSPSGASGFSQEIKANLQGETLSMSPQTDGSRQLCKVSLARDPTRSANQSWDMSKLAKSSAICKNLLDGFEESCSASCLGSIHFSHEVMDVCADAELSFSNEKLLGT